MFKKKIKILFFYFLRKGCINKKLEKKHKIFKGAPFKKSNPKSMDFFLLKTKDRSLKNKKKVFN